MLTISDSRTGGRGDDASGDAIVAWGRTRGDEVVWRQTVPDQTVEIVRALLDACDRAAAELVVTTGGTGFAARDVTPEATRAVIEREAPGLAALMRGDALAAHPKAALGRGVAGVRGGTLVVNLPGAPAAVRDALGALDPVIAHAADLVRGRATRHPD